MKAMVQPTAEARRDARALLSSLAVGDTVIVTDGGRDLAPISVVRTLHHEDGAGTAGSYGVKLSYGPGRYSTFVSIDRVALGFVTLRPVAS